MLQVSDLGANQRIRCYFPATKVESLTTGLKNRYLYQSLRKENSQVQQNILILLLK